MPGSAGAAYLRLKADQRLRPLTEQRVRLQLAATRLEQTGRAALIGIIAGCVKQDPRYATVLQRLIRFKVPGSDSESS